MRSGGNYPTYSVQLCFIVYLLLGQAIALFAWRLVAGRGKGEPSWWGRFAFVLYLLVAQAGLFVGWRLLIGLWRRQLVADPFVLADVVCVAHFAVVVGVVLLLLL